MENGIEDANVERIRERAYALWEEEGCPAGRAEHHWLSGGSSLPSPETYRAELATAAWKAVRA